MDDLYRDYILEHYRSPHNFGVLDDPTVSIEGANPLCGDRITLMVGVKDGVVDRVGFTGRGCAISQASASLLTDEIKGKPLKDVASFRADDLLDLLGIELEEAAAPGEACVVDEKSYSRMPFSDPGGNVVDLRAVGDVTDLRLSAELGRDPLELRLSAGQEDAVPAAG